MIISTINMEKEFRDLLKREFPTMPIHHAQMSDLSKDELENVQILITYGYDLPPSTATKMKRLKWLHVAQSGMDQLPISLLQEKGVFLTNSRGINSSIMSEYVLCAMLNVTRKTFVYAERARQKIWDSETTVEELGLKTVGIFGLGKVGRQVAKKSKAFGMRVLGVDIHNDEVPFVDQVFPPHQRFEVLANSDFIVLCLPLLPTTMHIIDEKELSMMPDTAWIINVGRGPLIHAEALVDAIETKKIAGAVLDVFATEPLPADDRLWGHENIWITPHTAGDHFAQYGPRVIEIFRYNLAQYPQFEQMQNAVRYDLYFQG